MGIEPTCSASQHHRPVFKTGPGTSLGRSAVLGFTLIRPLEPPEVDQHRRGEEQPAERGVLIAEGHEERVGVGEPLLQEAAPLLLDPPDLPGARLRAALGDEGPRVEQRPGDARDHAAVRELDVEPPPDPGPALPDLADRAPVAVPDVEAGEEPGPGAADRE